MIGGRDEEQRARSHDSIVMGLSASRSRSATVLIDGVGVDAVGSNDRAGTLEFTTTLL